MYVQVKYFNPCISSAAICKQFDFHTLKLPNTFSVTILHQLWSKKTFSIRTRDNCFYPPYGGFSLLTLRFQVELQQLMNESISPGGQPGGRDP